MLKPDICLYYPAVTFFCDKVMSVARNEQDDVPLIINCEKFTNLDYTSIKGIETLSKKLNQERNRFWLLLLNSDVVESFDIFADNKYIRLIKNEENIADILHDDTLFYQESEDPNNIVIKKATEMKKLDCEDSLYSSTLRHKDSETNAEELGLMSSPES